MSFGSLLGIGLVVALAVGSILFSIFKALLAREALGRVPAVCDRLIVRASHRLPPEHRESLLAEWRGEIAALAAEQPLSALAEALSLNRAAGQIAAELGRSTLAGEPVSRGRAAIGERLAGGRGLIEWGVDSVRRRARRFGEVARVTARSQASRENRLPRRLFIATFLILSVLNLLNGDLLLADVMVLLASMLMVLEVWLRRR